jgi:hypothetical protein
VWTISPPLPHDAHLAGSGQAVVDVATQGFLARSSGEKTLDLWSADWMIPAGHRIAVRVTDANRDWWQHVPVFDSVQVVSGSVTLPFLTHTPRHHPGGSG